MYSDLKLNLKCIPKKRLAVRTAIFLYIKNEYFLYLRFHSLIFISENLIPFSKKLQSMMVGNHC
jgi:hypothetical protein